MNFMPGEDVAEVDHPLAGIGRIGAFREAVEQFIERDKRVARRTWITLGFIGGKKLFKKPLALNKRGQTFQVIGIIHVGVLGVQADKAVGGGDGRLIILRPEVGINQFQLGLFSVIPEWILGFQGLQVFNRLKPVA